MFDKQTQLGGVPVEERTIFINAIKEDGLVHDIYEYMMEHDPNFKEFVEHYKTENK